MVSRCEITGKGRQFGHNVSFSLRRTPKIWKPNLQKKTIIIDGQKVHLTVSASAIRTLKKKNAFELLAKPSNKKILELPGKSIPN